LEVVEGANLSGVNLAGANLSSANLFRSDLVRATLAGADLLKASLDQEELQQVNGDEDTRLPPEINPRRTGARRATNHPRRTGRTSELPKKPLGRSSEKAPSEHSGE
jgi:hypothetical protein